MTGEIDIQAEETDLTETPKDASANPSATPKFNLNQYEDKLKGTWRAVWGGVVGLATIGGVLGLYQFIASPQYSTLSSADMISSLASEGVISTEQAEKLELALLSGDANQGLLDTFTLDEEPALEGARDRIMAQAKMLDPSAFMDSLDELEATAQTFEDWEFIAEVSIYKDPNRSVRATKRAIMMDSSNFRMLALRAQALSAAGRGMEAKRSAESLRQIATTRLEKLTAEMAHLSIVLESNDIEKIERAYAPFSIATYNYANNYAKTNDLNLPIADMKIDEIDHHPMWILAVSNQVAADTEIRLEKFDKAIISSKNSITNFERVRESVVEVDQHNIFLRIFDNHVQQAKIYEKLEKPAKAHASHTAGIQTLKQAMEASDRSVDMHMANTWRAMAKLSYLRGDASGAGTEFLKAINGFETILESNPDHSTAFDALKRVREEYKASVLLE